MTEVCNMKKILSVICVIPIILAMTLALAAPVYASEAETETAAELHHVINPDGVISEKNANKIETAAEAVFEKNGIDLFTVITKEETPDFENTVDSIYKNTARKKAAVILLMDSENAYLITRGRAENIFSSDELDEILAQSLKQKNRAAMLLRFVKLTGASLTEKGVEPIPDGRLLPRLVDEAELLSKSEAEKLLATLDEISERRQLDIVVVTNNSLGEKNVTQYADDFFDYNGYGFGENHDGILLLLSMDTREWAISTCGSGIDIFTDRGQEYMTDEFLPYISDGEYYDGFNRFAELCDEFAGEYADSGKAYDYGNMPKQPFGWFKAIIGSLAIGLVAGLIVALVLCSQLNSVKPQNLADEYAKKGSLKLTEKNDLYLYHTITRTARPKDTDSSSGGSSGGSSSHSSSSGSSHGGSHGHF